MRIGIDCRTILNPDGGEKAGIGHYTEALVRHLVKVGKQHEFVLFFDNKEIDTSPYEAGNVKISYIPFAKYHRYLPYMYSHMMVAMAMKQQMIDVLHGPANTLPLQYRGKSVITVHDLAIYSHPEWFPDGQSFAVNTGVPKSIERATKIIAVSEATKQDIIKQFKIPESKIEVIFEGVEPFEGVTEEQIQAIQAEYQIKKRYIFFVGTIEPRKNLARLIQAYDQMMLSRPERDRNISLVIAGAKGWKCDEIFSHIKDAKFAHNIRYLNYVTEEQKHALLQGARCFAFPSLYEGFGLPILEAMQARTPVVTSNLGSMPEVGGSAAIYVNPEDVNSIAQGLSKAVFGRDADARIDLGRALSKKYSWERAAKETLKLYEGLEKN